ncbi:hypothetical protein GQ43DRAFT_483288 [Delitschia confertaspora ATCC 74209]|uniref:Phosphoglycerate mutase family protein n=1 Tax=Delitschia confertaspora ATCC 74209 TaxID=1513339 RepID=A0A9P4JKN4_9PLEO|nr:hypothetical protein GQ43DRAFT_483288 [Delitschia confertaspora ATCC 74209]
MPKAPSVVIIARHGARLDAADKTWHLTSPTPYDPPLTYGGWTQSKALGLRIASLLHAREHQGSKIRASTSTENKDVDYFGLAVVDGSVSSTKNHGEGKQSRKRKQKIIIHTSPYLRCVQTSTAIAAGISQFHPVSEQHLETARPNDGLNTPSTEAHGSLSDIRRSHQHSKPEKILLRIDAFLGEWLSPDYFEDITPPPNSTMMVAGAKADLLRRGEYVEIQQNTDHSKGHFPGGWVKGESTTANGKSSRAPSQDSPIMNMGSLSLVSPFRERASSQGSTGGRPSQKGTSSLSTAHKVPSHIYDPPIPSYAVSPAGPIPGGYVAHARDACIDVDFQWDSMREPQEWGDGGEYGDEWSTMHKRFRKGLSDMITWYKERGCARNHSNENKSPSDKSTEDEEEGEEETVLILVTHGAGCNALLGAISNQPMLLDIGVASLSMAVRKDGPVKKTAAPPLPSLRRSSLVEMGTSGEYELKISASVDHLKHGVNPAKLPQPASTPATIITPMAPYTPTLDARRRYGGQSTPIEPPLLLSDPFKGVNSSLGSIRRTPSATQQPVPRTLSNASNSSPTSPTTGLWTRAPPRSEGSDATVGSPGRDMVLNFGDYKPKAATSKDKKQVENDIVTSLPTTLTIPKPTGLNRSVSGNGLWGPPPSSTQNERVPGPKRRWTVTERD